MATAPAASGAVTRTVVGIADLAVSADPEVVLVTYALGSCIGITVHDPGAGVGGLLHVMLPSSRIDPERARTNPERFVDTGLPLLFRRAYALGATKGRIVARAVGGASMLPHGQADRFQTGRRNFVALKKLLWKNGVLLQSQDIGGRVSRTLALHVGTGTATVKTEGTTRTL